jgi:hypothetical protein
MRYMTFAAVVVGLGAVSACSSSSSSDGSGGSGASSQDTTTTSGTGGTGGGGGGAGGTLDCSAEATAAACGDCCETQTPGGNAAVLSKTYIRCGCDAMAPCLEQCETNDATNVCGADGTINLEAARNNRACAGCIIALADDAACMLKFASDCNADPTCKTYGSCIIGCPM